ncbi:MAG: RNA methyltransferase [Oscillospiraceae bacterium]|nr:RNA methyltransferase [Oscillospiraceae bacterium]
MEKITSKDNPKVREYAKLGSLRKYRQEKNAFVIEGGKLLEEALRSGIEVLSVYVTDRWLEGEWARLIDGLEEKTTWISDAVEQKIRQSQTPQGVYAVCRMLDNPVNPDKMEMNGTLLGLWNLQDPGNVGTMIRAADAMGVDGVVLSRDCCDLYNLKTLRAAMGSLFRMPVLVTDMAGFLEKYRGEVTGFAAVVTGGEDLTEVDFPGKSMIVIGNEGNGLSPEQAEACDRKVTIPMRGNAESLNAAMAATILLWEMAGKRK